MTTSTHYSPWDILPTAEPRTVSPPLDYFYENVAKHLIKDTVRVTSNGLGIDLDEVGRLEVTINDILNDVRSALAINPLIIKYSEQRYSSIIAAYKEDRLSKCKPPSSYLVPFKHSDQTHRSYFMHVFSLRFNIHPPSELLTTGVPKWSAALVKKLAPSYPLLDRLVAGTISPDHPIVVEALSLLAQHKSDLYNRKYIDQISTPIIEYPKFSPRSPDQKHELLTGLLGYESNELTAAYEKYEKAYLRSQRYHTVCDVQCPKNRFSWGRKQLELLLLELTDPYEVSLMQNLIDFSFGDKIITSFIPSFYQYTIDGRLYSNLKLLGAKSGRYTSSDPNMLQLPSTNSIYASAIKKCFVSAPGFIILTADFNALEDRVLASITNDEGKCSILEKGLDGHSYNSLAYYKDEVESIIGTEGTYEEKAIKFGSLYESNKELKSIRQRSKAVTFKLAYLGVSDSDKGGAITPEIYNAYHKVLYPDVRNYIDNYVIPTATTNGRIHLGLGFYINTTDASKDQRTLHNATIQFWSILTAITINKLHQLIDAANLSSDIFVITTIYDSIYLEVRNDPTIVKWANDNLISCMTKDFMINQRIPNTAESDVGVNWYDLHRIHNGASLGEVTDILTALRNNYH